MQPRRREEVKSMDDRLGLSGHFPKPGRGSDPKKRLPPCLSLYVHIHIHTYICIYVYIHAHIYGPSSS